MKKITLLIALVIFVATSVSVHAQSSKINASKYNRVDVNKHQASQAATPISGKEAVSDAVSEAHPTTTGTARAADPIGTVVGYTSYDLQTNNSIARRVVMDDDGTAHMVWTYDLNFSAAAPDRGTGYNYVNPDGSVGIFPGSIDIDGNFTDPDVVRIESDRNGWPNLVRLESGRLINVSHFAGAATEGLTYSYKDPESDWVTGALSDYGVGVDDDTWARVAASGNTVHIIASKFTANDPCGLPGGLTYYRSEDGGETWTTFDGAGGCLLSNVEVGSVGGDSYAIEANGDNVAVTIGFFNIILLKSSDGGLTWDDPVYINDKIDRAYGANDGEVLSEDAVLGTDGGLSMVIDNDGKVHIWAGNIVATDDDPAAGYSYYPSAINALVYWNEDMGTTDFKSIGQTAQQDYDGDLAATLDLSPDVNAGQQYGNGLVGMPSAAIDADGNLYVVYSSVREDELNGNTLYFYSTYLIKSTDNGTTWCGPVRMTPDTQEEAVYASVARDVVDGIIHMTYMSDTIPGHSISGIEHTPGLNAIRYVQFDASDVPCLAQGEYNNTVPDIFMPLIPNQIITGCDATAELFAPFWIVDYPDGDITDITVGGPATAGDYLTTDWVFEFTDSDANTVDYSADLVDADGNPYALVVYDDPNPPVIYGEPTYFLGNDADGNPIFDDSEFQTYYSTIDLLVGSTYEDLGAYVFDEGNYFSCDANANLVVDNPVDTNTPGTYVVRYNATDVNGMAGEEVIRTINVISDDLEAPVLVVYDADGNPLADGASVEENFVEGAAWDGLAVFAFDNVDLDISSNVSANEADVNLGAAGSYDVTYTATDGSGNATSITITVVVADSAPPTITLIGSPTVAIPCGSTDSQLDFTDVSLTYNGAPVSWSAVDNVDGNISANVTVTGAGDVDLCAASTTGAPVTFVLTYNVTDAAGNPATSVTRNVLILQPCPDPVPAWCGGIGIYQSMLEVSVQLFPNPTQGVFNVTNGIGNGTETTVEVFNPAGELVKEVLTLTGSTTVDLSNSAAGIYFVKVSSHDSSVIRKIVLDN